MNTTVNNNSFDWVTQGHATSATFRAAVAAGDVLTLIQFVQLGRVRFLDQALIDQVEKVQAANDQLAKLSAVMSRLTNFLAAIEGAEPGGKVKKWDWDKVDQLEIPLNDAIREAGIDDLGFNGAGRRTPLPGESVDDGHGHIVRDQTNMANQNTTRGQLEAAKVKVQGLMDALTNNQQTDMVRLNALLGKKNEAIETVTNTQKKVADTNSGIISKL